MSTAVASKPKISPETADACLLKWRADPMAFFTEVLDVNPDYVWEKMSEVCESVRDNARTCVGAGHSLSKTFCAGRLPIWFLMCFGPATVITTAPTAKLVEEQLWRELRQAHGNARYAPLSGKLTRTKLDLQEETGQKWYALGFSTRPDNVTQHATNFQGFHNDHILIIFDEAAGIPTEIWLAAETLMTAGFARMLVIGNPTSDGGEFAEVLGEEKPGLQRNGWNYINISVLDTPNYKAGKEIIPGVSGRPFAEYVANKYGVESNEYKVRVLGKKPDFSEATFWGRQLVMAQANGQMGFYPHEPRNMVYTGWDLGNMYTAIWFFQPYQDKFRMIDFYYDSGGQGLPAYAALLRDKANTMHYRYAQHFGPWDIGGSDARNLDVRRGPNAKSMQTGKLFTDMAAEYGIQFTVIEKYSIESQRFAAGDMIGRFQFNENTCSDGWLGLKGYRKRKDETRSTTDRPVYYNEAVRDWSIHVGSAFCTTTMAILEYIEVDGVMIGHPDPVEAMQAIYGQENNKPYDPFGGRVRRMY